MGICIHRVYHMYLCPNTILGCLSLKLVQAKQSPHPRGEKRKCEISRTDKVDLFEISGHPPNILSRIHKYFKMKYQMCSEIN